MISEVSSFQASVGNIYGKNKSSAAEEFSIPSVERADQAADMSASEKAADFLAIAKEYDITNISPNKLAEMGEKLYKGGHISGLQYSLFCMQAVIYDDKSGFRASCEADGIYLQDADTPKNYLEYYRYQLEKVGHPNRSCLENAMKDAALAEKLAALHKQATDKSFQSLGEIQTAWAGPQQIMEVI